ncbi:MATE family efflux transporter [Shewanella intestini]|uniref:Multidrug export protein MepA n=1 Tax=Shewanella intestini TaxID=2017544 RepID=A0ABS5HZM5_9GAMM|nr:MULTISPECIES: MATE family efflux transporter [Shewanella]MBR9727216.1 MATE family efflux transporter [Shewanella intestini]MRG36018.1 MATE family efflux transporter [Shewanella sp. XMDDZSB0408]
MSFEPKTSVVELTVSKHFWKYAIPSITAMLVSGLYQIIDGIFVGHYIGYEGLAGINMAWPIICCIVGVGMMIGMGAGSLLSISRGADAPNQAKRVVNNAAILVILMSFLSAIMIGLFGQQLLLLQSASGSSLSMATDYIEVFVYGAFFTTAATALPLLVRNDENPALATKLLIMGAALNIGLDYLFIAVWEYELKGAAIATLLSQVAVVLLAINYFVSPKANTRLKLTIKNVTAKEMSSILTLGSSSLIMFLYFSFIIALHNYLFMKFGSAVHVAAFAIVGYVATLFYLLAEGIAGGMQPPVSYYYGAKNMNHIKATVLLAVKVTGILGICSVAFINLFPEHVISFFISEDAALMAETLTGMRLHLFALVLDGFIFIASMYYMAVNQAKIALMVSFANMFIQIPFLFILPNMIGVNGIWLAVPLSNVALSLLLLPFIIKEIKRINGLCASNKMRKHLVAIE